ncbi:hypothetical protein ACWGI8_22570, partial [Streptomyces sp. NPDC054841]
MVRRQLKEISEALRDDWGLAGVTFHLPASQSSIVSSEIPGRTELVADEGCILEDWQSITAGGLGALPRFASIAGTLHALRAPEPQTRTFGPADSDATGVVVVFAGLGDQQFAADLLNAPVPPGLLRLLLDADGTGAPTLHMLLAYPRPGLPSTVPVRLLAPALAGWLAASLWQGHELQVLFSGAVRQRMFSDAVLSATAQLLTTYAYRAPVRTRPVVRHGMLTLENLLPPSHLTMSPVSTLWQHLAVPPGTPKSAFTTLSDGTLGSTDLAGARVTYGGALSISRDPHVDRLVDTAAAAARLALAAQGFFLLGTDLHIDNGRAVGFATHGTDTRPSILEPEALAVQMRHAGFDSTRHVALVALGEAFANPAERPGAEELLQSLADALDGALVTVHAGYQLEISPFGLVSASPLYSTVDPGKRPWLTKGPDSICLASQPLGTGYMLQRADRPYLIGTEGKAVSRQPEDIADLVAFAEQTGMFLADFEIGTELRGDGALEYYLERSAPGEMPVDDLTVAQLLKTWGHREGQPLLVTAAVARHNHGQMVALYRRVADLRRSPLRMIPVDATLTVHSPYGGGRTELRLGYDDANGQMRVAASWLRINVRTEDFWQWYTDGYGHLRRGSQPVTRKTLDLSQPSRPPRLLASTTVPDTTFASWTDQDFTEGLLQVVLDFRHGIPALAMADELGGAPKPHTMAPGEVVSWVQQQLSGTAVVTAL